jgi:hypothetical protein
MTIKAKCWDDVWAWLRTLNVGEPVELIDLTDIGPDTPDTLPKSEKSKNQKPKSGRRAWKGKRK